MLALISGQQNFDVNSTGYLLFQKLCCQGFLAIRPMANEIITLVELMLESGFPCFRGNSIGPLRSRFCSSSTQKDAIGHMREIVKRCYMSSRTHFYDQFQYMQNGIY